MHTYTHTHAQEHANRPTAGQFRIALGQFSSTDSERALPVTSQQATCLHYDEEMPQFLRALVTGAAGTPYAYGVFLFDMLLSAGGTYRYLRVGIVALIYAVHECACLQCAQRKEVFDKLCQPKQAFGATFANAVMCSCSSMAYTTCCCRLMVWYCQWLPSLCISYAAI